MAIAGFSWIVLISSRKTFILAESTQFAGFTKATSRETLWVIALFLRTYPLKFTPSPLFYWKFKPENLNVIRKLLLEIFCGNYLLKSLLKKWNGKVCAKKCWKWNRSCLCWNGSGNWNRKMFVVTLRENQTGRNYS